MHRLAGQEQDRGVRMTEIAKPDGRRRILAERFPRRESATKVIDLATIKPPRHRVSAAAATWRVLLARSTSGV
jgi:hypothetical protein